MELLRPLAPPFQCCGFGVFRSVQKNFAFCNAVVRADSHPTSKYGGAGVAALVIVAIESNVFFARPRMKTNFCKVFHRFSSKTQSRHFTFFRCTYYLVQHPICCVLYTIYYYHYDDVLLQHPIRCLHKRTFFCTEELL